MKHKEKIASTCNSLGMLYEKQARSQGGYMAVPGLHGGYLAVVWWLRGGYAVATRWLFYVKAVWLHAGYTPVTRGLHGSDTDVPRERRSDGTAQSRTISSRSRAGCSRTRRCRRRRPRSARRRRRTSRSRSLRSATSRASCTTRCAQHGPTAVATCDPSPRSLLHNRDAGPTGPLPSRLSPRARRPRRSRRSSCSRRRRPCPRRRLPPR